jgi:hypothetical protein
MHDKLYFYMEKPSEQIYKTFCSTMPNKLSSMMYGSDLSSICYTHEFRKKCGREFQEYISAHCLLCSKQLFDFFLLDKSNMVNDVPENDNFCLNPVSSWRCGLWSQHSSPYSLQVLGQSWYFEYLIVFLHNVGVALLWVKYMRIARIIGYGVPF